MGDTARRVRQATWVFVTFPVPSGRMARMWCSGKPAVMKSSFPSKTGAATNCSVGPSRIHWLFG